MIQSEKDTPGPYFERASAPGTKGSVTIEAAFAIPIFLFAVLCLIYLMELQSIKISILNAAHSAAKSAAEDTAVIPVLNSIGFQSDMIDLIGEERLERSIIDGGSSGITCWKSYVSPAAGEMNIIVEYRVKVPLPIFGSPSVRMKEEFKISAWMGYQDGRMEEGDNESVYVTENGTVYHSDYQCSYLQLSIKYVPYTSLGGIRNEDGGRYHKCEKCVYGPDMSGVYITEYGNRYHNSLGCSGLKRTIRAVKKSEVYGMGGCSKCSQ